MSIRILLADDHGMMREGLKLLITKQMGMDVIGECNNGHAAVQKARELKPDVVVMDIGMPDLNGIEATRQIAQENEDIKVLALSQYSDPRMVSEMFRAGAKGFVLKDSAVEELIRAIHTVCTCRTYVSPDIAGDFVRRHVRKIGSNEEGSAFALLSDREREVLQLLAEGKSTKEIAAKLFRSGKTIETHRHNIMHKLNLHSLPELTKYAVRQGLTGLEK